jgi:fatty-acyl-CoA synthase
MTNPLYQSTTFAKVLVDSLAAYPSQIAFEQGSLSYTYAATATRIAQFIEVFRQHGIGPGTGLGVLSKNHPESWMAAVAIQLAGGYYVALPAYSSAADLAFQSDDAGISAVLVHPSLGDLAAEMLAQASTVKTVFSLGPSDLGEDLCKAADAVGEGLTLRVDDSVDLEHASHLWYTGGTTGRPKGVIHTQLSTLQYALRYRDAAMLAAPPRWLVAGPLSHSGYTPVLPTLMRGGTVVSLDGFDVEEVVKAVKERHVNSSVLLPTMIYGLLDYCEEHGTDLTGLERIIYGGSPMSPARLLQGRERWGDIFVQAYSQTEHLGAITVLQSHEHLADDEFRMASCGRPVPGTDVALVDEELNPVAVGEVGELCVRGPGGVMKGYHNMPDRTAETFRGGWLHTGDMAMKDGQGFVRIVDRKKDMIISGGFNVYSAEVEAALTEHPDVSAAAVFAVPDAKWGEAVHAAVVAVPGKSIDAEELVAFVGSLKGSVKTPKSIDVLSELPRTATLKIDKKALRQPYWESQGREVN